MAVGLIGWAMWRFRAQMRWFRRGLIAVVMVTAVTMKAPIWYLPARASSLTGGDGWHRSYLMDVAFQNVDKWWAAGMSIRDTAGCPLYELDATGGADITNQFLSIAFIGGALSMVILIGLLTLAFHRLGLALAAVRSSGDDADGAEYLLWGLGAMLAAHIINWLGITYFDQTYVIWFMQLAAISGLTESCLRRTAVKMSDHPDARVEMERDESLLA